MRYSILIVTAMTPFVLNSASAGRHRAPVRLTPTQTHAELVVHERNARAAVFQSLINPVGLDFESVAIVAWPDSLTLQQVALGVNEQSMLRQTLSIADALASYRMTAKRGDLAALMFRNDQGSLELLVSPLPADTTIDLQLFGTVTLASTELRRCDMPRGVAGAPGSTATNTAAATIYEANWIADAVLLGSTRTRVSQSPFGALTLTCDDSNPERGLVLEFRVDTRSSPSSPLPEDAPAWAADLSNAQQPALQPSLVRPGTALFFKLATAPGQH